MLHQTTTIQEVGYLNLNPKDPFVKFSLWFNLQGIIDWVRGRWEEDWCDGAKSVGVAGMAMILLAALQAVLPVLSAFGGAKVPLLPALVVCYALSHSLPTALGVALVAGVFQDSLSLTPLGLSSTVLCAVVLVVASFRDLVMHRSYLSQAVVGSMGIALAGAALFFVLSLQGAVMCPASVVTLRIAVASLLGGVLVVPLFYSLLHRLDRRFGDDPSVEGWHDAAV